MKKQIISAALALAIASLANAQEVTLKLSGGGLSAADKEHEVKFKVGGRLMWDYNNASKNDKTDESDLAVRRARIYIQTEVGDWKLKSQFNLAEDAADAGSVEDLYIQYKGLGEQAKVTIGRQNAEFGLEQLTSSNDMPFLERSAATERYFVGRTAGLQLQGDVDTLHYALGLFEDIPENANDKEIKEQASRVFAIARATYAFKTDKALIHTGLGFHNKGEDSETLGLELAAVSGPMHAQAEYFENDTDGATSDAYNVQLGYVLTGESRPYKEGKFKRIKPAASTGAYEVVIRYTEGDANFGDTEIGEVDGSEYGIGFNYYATNNVKLGLSYSESESNENDDEGEEFRARAQFVF